ncbi:MAG: hypothetical protein ACE5PT_14160, partial [Gemmatimonadales bacterium]
MISPADLAFREWESRHEAPSRFARVWHRPRYLPVAHDEDAYDALARSIRSGRGYQLDRQWIIARA